MLTSKNKRNKKILLMALQCDSQINQNCHQQRKVLLKENTMNESNTITSITCKTNKQNTLSPVEEFLSDIQPFDELLPVINNDNNNVNLTEVHVNEEPFVLPELIGDSFDTLEEISTHNLTELVPVTEENKPTAIENPFVESPTFEQTVILECCVSTVNNANDNVKLTNHTTTSQEILNNNTKVNEEPTILLDNINDSFEKIEPREKNASEEKQGPINIEIPPSVAPTQEANENCVATNDTDNEPSIRGTMLTENPTKRKRPKENQRELN